MSRARSPADDVARALFLLLLALAGPMLFRWARTSLLALCTRALTGADVAPLGATAPLVAVLAVLLAGALLAAAATLPLRRRLPAWGEPATVAIRLGSSAVALLLFAVGLVAVLAPWWGLLGPATTDLVPTAERMVRSLFGLAALALLARGLVAARPWALGSGPAPRG